MADNDATKPTKKGLQGQFAGLRQRFVQRFSADCERLLSLCTKVEAQPGSADDPKSLEAALTDIRHLLHSLAGTSGTFGFVETGEEARERLAELDALTDGQTLSSVEAQVLVTKIRAFASRSLEAEPPQREARRGVGEQPGSGPGQCPETGSATKPGEAWLVSSPPDLKEMSESLSAFGFGVHNFGDLASLTSACREALRNNRLPTLVMLDLDLLKLSPRNAAPLPMLESDTLAPSGPTVLAFSNRDDFNQRLLAARLGAAYFKVKPLDFAQMIVYLLRDMDQQLQGPPRVMMVEDDHILASYLATRLQEKGIRCTLVSDPTAIIEQAAEFKPELVLMDLELGDLSGDELAAILRQKDEFRSLPIVYLSAATSEARQIRALKRGADDFLKKPVAINALFMYVESKVRRYRELKDLINLDGMTGLLKHSSFLEQAERLLSWSRREGKPLAFVMLDIDWFKKVNDAHGHGVGDTVIKALASLLRRSVRQADLVGRYGGEEFALALLDCSAEDAREKLDALRKTFAHLDFQSGEERFNCSVSMGVALCDQNTEGQALDFIELADRAMYQSKKAGRNRLTLFTG